MSGNGYEIMAIGGREATMNQIAAAMSSKLERPVVDRTGLAGFFDFVVAPPGRSGDPLAARAEFFTHLQEQLGLRLQPDRGEVEILVVSDISRPAKN